MRLVGLILVFLVAVPARADDDRRKRSDEFTTLTGYNYQVSFPNGERKVETKELATAAGAVRMTTVRVEAGRELMVSVVVSVYPQAFSEVAAKTVLDGVRAGLKGSDGQLVLDKELTLTVNGSDVPGREIRVEAGKNSVRCQAFLRGNVLYQVMAAGAKDAVVGRVADRVMNSFELTDVD